MGEWSKSIGEKGERITKFIFEDILGVNSLVENTSVNCSKTEKHKRKEAKKNRESHGLDGLYYLESPTEDELLDIVLISSKYTNAYPKYPKSDFKDHIKDLAQTIECFKSSEENSKINQKFNSVTKTEFTGVLVWLSNTDSVDYELIPKVSTSLIDSDLEFEKIILLDNNRVQFLYDVIYRIREKFKDVEFVYHNSSLNNGNMNKKSYGKKFPINYLYSDVLMLRVDEKDEVIFYIYVNDNFNGVNFSQILSFAKSYDYLNATHKTYVNYMDYNDLEHEKIAKSVLIDYDNFRFNENLILNKFPSDFRG